MGEGREHMLRELVFFFKRGQSSKKKEKFEDKIIKLRIKVLCNCPKERGSGCIPRFKKLCLSSLHSGKYIALSTSALYLVPQVI